MYFTSFREQDEAYINSLRGSTLVGLEPADLPVCYGRRLLLFTRSYLYKLV